MKEEHSDNVVGYPLASPLDRLLAAFIDWLIIGLLGLTGFGAILGIAYLLTKDSLPLYEGQSLGKKLIGIKVVNSETHEPIVNQYDKCLIRNVSLLIPVFQFIDAFMVFSSDRKRFGDQWASTVVIKEI